MIITSWKVYINVVVFRYVVLESAGFGFRIPALFRGICDFRRNDGGYGNDSVCFALVE